MHNKFDELSYGDLTPRKKTAEDRKKHLIYLLELDSSKRTPQDCEMIANYVKDYEFFSNYKNHPLFMELCRKIVLRRLSPAFVVYYPGEFGDCIYVVLDGGVKLYVRDPITRDLNELHPLKEGGAFGQSALRENPIRTEKVVTEKYTDLIVIKSIDVKIFEQSSSVVMTSRLSQFFSDTPGFEMIDPKFYENLAKVAEIKKFDSDCLLIKQGSLISKYCLVLSGFAKVYRTVSFRIDTETKELTGDVKDPLPDEMDTGLFKKLNLNISDLGIHHAFAEAAAFSGERINYSVISASKMEIIILPVDSLKKVLDASSFELLKSKAREYPDDVELRNRYFDHIEWQKVKPKILKDFYQKHAGIFKKRNKSLKNFSMSMENNDTSRISTVNASINVNKSQNLATQISQMDITTTNMPKFQLPNINFRPKIISTNRSVTTLRTRNNDSTRISDILPKDMSKDVFNKKYHLKDHATSRIGRSKALETSSFLDSSMKEQLYSQNNENFNFKN